MRLRTFQEFDDHVIAASHKAPVTVGIGSILRPLTPEMLEATVREQFYYAYVEDIGFAVSAKGTPYWATFSNGKIKNTPPPPKPEAPMDARYFATQTELTYPKDLERLVGMNGPKAEVERIACIAEMMKRRELLGLPKLSNSRHLVFTGNPGTGKTTFARIIAKVYHQHGLLPRKDLIEVDRSQLVAGFIGQSEGLISEKIQEAEGATLFIDEFHGLSVDGKDFGNQVINVLVKRMEDWRDKLCVIIAGYTEPMRMAVASNPGLKSRFTRTIHFPDYTAQELVQIFDGLLNKAQYSLQSQAYGAVGQAIRAHHAIRGPDFGNARDIRNFFERLTEVQAYRVIKAKDNQMTNITVEDVEEAARLTFAPVPAAPIQAR